MLGIILSLLALSLLILLHEWGHYYFAKKNGVKVEEFAVGFPPRLWSFTKHGTKFLINLIPFGGYVKIYGEDSNNKALQKDSKSFASKSHWVKTKIILAGVAMNFLIFWVLSSLAFTLGVNPMVQSEEDLKQLILNQQMQASLVTPALVEKQAKALEIGFDPLQEISIDKEGKLLWGDRKLSNLSHKALQDFGLTVPARVSLPALKIVDVAESSLFYNVLRPQDELLLLNQKVVFDLNVLVSEFENSQQLELQIRRDGQYMTLELEKANAGLVVAGVLEDSQAAAAGLEIGDSILSVDQRPLSNFQDLIVYNQAKLSESVDLALRNPQGENLSKTVELDEQGRLGVYLSRQFNLKDLGLDFWIDSHPFFIEVLEKDEFPFYVAPWVALSKAPHFAYQTVVIFAQTLKDVFVHATVSEQVGGPLKVVSMGSFVFDLGLAEFLNFIAVISLSLAVLNLLPIPALDGGRFLFILIEAMTGRPINTKLATALHIIGFIVLMGFIIMITIFDIIRF